MSFRSLVPLFSVAVLLFSSACADEQTYDVQGRVAGFGDDGETLIVEHEDIQGLMPAMTMPFTVRDTAALADLQTGDAVAFRLTVTSDRSWIGDIRELPDTAVAAHPAGRRDMSYGDQATRRVLETGDEVPQFELITHADTTLRLRELEGKAVLLTFIYTRCPLPEYCPLMSQNFSELQPRLEERFGDRIHLLSVSFDPRNDSPQVLRDYARRYTDDLSTWTFATGDSVQVKNFAESFGEYYAETRSEIVHNLVTALIGPDGTIRKYWRGNEWTTDDVLRSVEQLNLKS